MDKKEFGKRLKNVRIRNKMSQQAMADSLGYTSRSTINKIEEGINEMSYDKIVRLMELYGLSRPDFGLEPICGNKLSGLRKDAKYPNPEIEEICYIKNCVSNPNIVVGDYSYYEDKKGADLFEKHVTYHYDFIGDKLIIGKFCQIGAGVEFIMNGANHFMKGLTTYPFNIFSRDLQKFTPSLDKMPIKGDTVIGNDVWIGQNVTILPGVHIGDGAIIGANSVVGSDIPPYTIAVGNPCRVIKKRFDDKTIEKLLNLKWWDYPIETIEQNIDKLFSGNIDELELSLKK